MWNWMKLVDCRSLSKAVELANVQAKSEETLQGSGAASHQATPLETKAYMQSSLSSKPHGKSYVSVTVTGISSGISAAVASPAPSLLSVNVLSSSIAATAQHQNQKEVNTFVSTGSNNDVALSASAQHTPAALLLAGGEFYCRFCPSTCTSSKQWLEHCASEAHHFNICSDRDCRWNYKPPPLHLNPEQYKLCVTHLSDSNKDGDPGKSFDIIMNIHVLVHTIYYSFSNYCIVLE